MDEIFKQFLERTLTGFDFADAIRYEIDRKAAIEKEKEMEKVMKEYEQNKQLCELYKQEYEQNKQLCELYKREHEQNKQQYENVLVVLMESLNLTYEEAKKLLEIENH